jgi:hypothetical protein
MRIDRRALMQGAALCALASTTLGKRVAMAATDVPCFAIFDSRRGAALAARQTIDIARDSANQWRELRSIGAARRVVGATTWSDFLQVRGVLQEQGLRVTATRHRAGLEYWSMESRAAARSTGVA